MTKPMVEEPMSTWMVLNMLVIGRTINNTGMVLRHGLMQQNLKEIMSLERNMASVPSNGPMAQPTSVNFTIIIFTEKEFTHGQTNVSMRVNGVQIKCMVKEHLHGLIIEDTLENMQTTKREGTENLYGLTEDATEVNGSTVSSMVRVPMSQVKARKNTENGKKENASDG